MIRVFYDAGALFIDGRDDPIPAGTLIAAASGSAISISSLHGTAPMVACDMAQIADIAGVGFPSADAAMAYLAGQFAMRPEAPTATGVAAVDLFTGQPLAVSRATGQLTPARADTYTLGFVVGLAVADTAAGFVAAASRRSVTLPDWTAIAGTPALAVGQPYFLAPTGGLTLQPPTLPGSQCSARVGCATAPQSFLFQPSPPIRL